MEYSARYINVDIKYNFVDELNVHHVSDEWTACRLNMKPSKSEEFCEFIEVNGFPVKYGQKFPHEFYIDVSNIMWEPTAAVSGRTWVYSIFWMSGDRICELYLSFPNESTYEAYVVYLENLLSSMARCQIVEEDHNNHEKQYLLNPTWNYGSVEEEMEMYEAINLFMKELEEDDDAVVPNAGIKSLRPISIISELFTAKRTPESKKKKKSTKNKKKSFVPKLLKKQKDFICNIFGRNGSSQSRENKLFANPPQHPESITDRYISIDEKNDLSVISTIKNNSFDANDLSMASLDSSSSSLCDTYLLCSQSSVTNLLDANINEEKIDSDTSIEADSHLTSFGKLKQKISFDDSFDVKNRPKFIFEEHEEDRRLNDSSLTSFFTAVDDHEENTSSGSISRRKLSFDDQSSSAISSHGESRCSRDSLLDSMSSDSVSSKSTESLNIHRTESVDLLLAKTSDTDVSNNIATSLLSIAAACVKKRICTPYRIKNNNTIQLKPFASNTSLDRPLIAESLRTPNMKYPYLKIKTDVATARNSGDSRPNNLKEKFAEAKSPSISKGVLQQISRIRKMTMSFVAASPRAMSLFV